MKDPKPIVINYSETCYELLYCIPNGGFHRLNNKPALLVFREDGTVDYEMYCVNGEKHRTDGPAWIEYGEDGLIIRCQKFCLFGKEVTRRKFYTPGFVDAFILENS